MALSYIRLYSGRKFHFLSPEDAYININDIAWSLSNLCRFTGHVKKFYSVAQHCCYVSDHLPPEFKLHGLLHDAQEAYCQDLAQPIKQFLPQYRDIEIKIEKAIAHKFGLAFPMPPIVKAMDGILLVTEMRDLMRGSDYKTRGFSPLPQKIMPWSPQRARQEFLKRYNKLS